MEISEPTQSISDRVTGRQEKACAEERKRRCRVLLIEGETEGAVAAASVLSDRPETASERCYERLRNGRLNVVSSTEYRSDGRSAAAAAADAERRC